MFAELAAAGAHRVSVGGALTWAALRSLADAAAASRDGRDFALIGASPPLEKWSAWFSATSSI